ENGRALARLLSRLDAEEIVLVGHSMGGLVARSAAAAGGEWVARLKQVVCIGSPHLGAPLAKGVPVLAAVLRAVDAAGTQVPASVLDGRSAGIRDLRTGCDVPFVDSVRYAFIAASVTRDPEHPLGQLVGDLLVRLPSAAGEIRVGRVLGGVNHLELQN